MEDSSELPSDPEELQAVIEEAETKLATLQEKLSQENCKREGYKVHVGLVVLVMKATVTSGTLFGAIAR